MVGPVDETMSVPHRDPTVSSAFRLLLCHRTHVSPSLIKGLIVFSLMILLQESVSFLIEFIRAIPLRALSLT